MSSTESSSNLELLDQDIPKPDLKSGTCQSTANDLEDLPCEGLLSDEEKGRPSDEAQADKTVKTADEAQPGPVDEGFSWVILAASVFVISAFPVNNMSYGVFLAELIDHYQRPQAVFGLMGAVRVFIIFMIGAVTSPLVHRYGCRAVACCGIILSTLGNVLSFAAPSYTFLFITYGIIAPAGGGCVYIPSQVIVQHYFKRHRSLAGGISSAGMSLAVFITSPLMQLSINTYGWRGGMIILGAMTLQSLVPAMLLFPHPRTKIKQEIIRVVNEESETKETTPIRQSPERKDSLEVAIKDPSQSKLVTCWQKLAAIVDNVLDLSLLHDPAFMVYAISCLPNSAVVATYTTYALHNAIRAGVSPMLASFQFTALGLGSILGRLLSGFIGNQKCTNRVTLFGTNATILGLVLIIAIIQTSSPVFHIALGFWMGFFIGSYQALYATVSVDIVQLERLPRAMGWIQFTRSLAPLLIISFGGWLYDVTGDYTATFISSGIVQVLGGLMALSVVPIMWRMKR